MHADSGSTTKKNVEQNIETQLDENGNCPDGKCPDKDNGCPDGNCDKLPEDRDGKCPDGRCPVRLLPPLGRHGNGHIPPIPRPHKGN
ncbi:MAG: hypothetical protein K2K04_05980 [Clostridia bacterium]|nr:hypothetical protein [Clostridia bacterium]